MVDGAKLELGLEGKIGNLFQLASTVGDAQGDAQGAAHGLEAVLVNLTKGRHVNVTYKKVKEKK
jgi:hypothetical protein